MSRRLAWGAALSLMATLWGNLAVRAAEPPPYRIYMALWRGWEDAAQGFADYLTQRGLRYELIVRDAGQDGARLAAMAREVETTRPDLLFTWGTAVSLGLLGRHDTSEPDRPTARIPAVFAIVSNPEAVGLLPARGPRPNVTGTRYLLPLTGQLNMIWSYRRFNRIGVVYNPQEPNSVATVDELAGLAQTWERPRSASARLGPASPEAERGFQLVARPVPVVDGRPDVSALPRLVNEIAGQGVDFLYIPPDTFLNIHRDVLTRAALAARLPTFAAAEAPVRESAAMFTATYSYYLVGRLAGRAAYRILQEHVAPASIPVEAPAKISVVLNMATIRDLGFYPPLNIIGMSETVH